MSKEKEPEYKIEIEYDRLVNGYKPGETVAGYIKISHTANKSFKQDVNSITMKVMGEITVNYSNSKKYLELKNNPDVPSVLFIQIEPKELIRNQTIDQATKLPFRFKLEEKNHPYQESYVGMFLSVSYVINVSVEISKDKVISDEIPFYVQVFQAGRGALEGQFEHPKPRSFILTDNELPSLTQGMQKAPKFKIKGEFFSEICMFNDGLEGFLIVDNSQIPIKTVDLQLIRVQTLKFKDRSIVQKTEVQLIQVCDGNITPQLQIPFYMMFPKYHCCPSVNYKGYEIDFETNLNIVFKGGFKVSINRPLKIIRS